MTRRALVLLLLPLLLAGCVGASLAEKRASYRPFQHLRVEGVLLEDYLSERTSMVLRDFDVSVVDTSYGTYLRLSPTGGEHQGFGTAVAITRDGYYLTAAHNLVGKTFYLLSRLPDDRVRVGRARIVFLGDPDEPGQDFAVLKSEGPTPVVFRWAPRSAIRPGTHLVAAGCVSPLAPLAFSAGRALEPIPPSDKENGPPSSLVVHDVPVRKGDSGGPLVTLDGRLVALNVIYSPISGRHLSVRPDPRWVNMIIDRDRLGLRTRHR